MEWVLFAEQTYVTNTTLMHSFSNSFLIYCIEVWSNALNIQLTPLRKLQNKIHMLR